MNNECDRTPIVNPSRNSLPWSPPTGLVLHGFPFNPTVVRLYKVELRVARS